MQKAILVALAAAFLSACGGGGPSKTPPFGDYMSGDSAGGDSMGTQCGNGRIEGAEVCDGANLDNQSCETRGFAAGILRCSNDCTDFDISGCTTCGNDNKDAGEACDGTDLGGATCISLGYEGGTLACNRSCDDYNTSDCITTAACGDGVAQDPEICDPGNDSAPADLRGKSCRTLGYDSGTLSCSSNCDAFDTSECVSGAECGNDTIEVPEVCDGTDLGDEDCISQGYASGTLACNDDCDGFVFTDCQAAVCGNGEREPGEPCEGVGACTGANVDCGTETCVSRGFIEGTLGCAAGCEFDTSGCSGTPDCGNDVLEGLELCDTDQLGGQTCQTLGFREGDLACTDECTFDTTDCSGEQQGMCGNGAINGVEFCDGDAWMYGSSACEAYGMGTGEVVCTAECQPDFTDCENPDLCDANGWYGDGYCDACDLLNGDPDPDCNLCGQADGNCISYYDTLTGVFTCQHAGTSDPDCGTCGDGVTEDPEWCDGDDLAGLTCDMFGFIGGEIACADDCTADLSGCVNPVCGNDVLEGQEMCDGTDLGGVECTDLGFAGGTLGCRANCQAYDTGRCEAATCDNGTLEVGEMCETGDLNGVTCEILGLGTGSLACATDCLSYDTIGCSGADPFASSCGDDMVNGLEVCEGTEWSFGTGVCMDFGLGDNNVTCTSACMVDLNACSSGTDLCTVYGWRGDGYCDVCQAYDGSAEVDPDCANYCGVADGFCPDYFDVVSGLWTCRSQGLVDPDCVCGNGVIEGSEYCDGSELGGIDCTEFGYLSGIIACADDCTPDFGACMGPFCGDDIVSEGEACDIGSSGTPNVGDLTCELLGFESGDLGCSSDCLTYDLTGCGITTQCGNGIIERGEVCDPGDGNTIPADLNDLTCTDFGRTAGSGLTCLSDCSDFDLSTCGPVIVATCGDDQINGAEWCDGDDFVVGPACDEFGMGSGEVVCTAGCIYDFTGCVGSQDYCAAQSWYNDGYCDACDLLGGTVDPDCDIQCGDNGECADYYDPLAGAWTCGHLGLVDPDCGECGNGVIEGNEYCDDTNLDGYTCEDYGFTGGDLACTGRCIPDFTGCDAPTCGDGNIEGFELCEPGDNAGYTCEDFGYTGGTLTCVDCVDFDFTNCINVVSTACGDNLANGLELCDDGDWAGGGPACSAFNMAPDGDQSVATCTDDCTIDFSACVETDFCEANNWYNDGYCDACGLLGGTPDEQCADLCGADGFCADYFDVRVGVWTCRNRGFTDPDCGSCGNGAVEGNEWCDGTDLDAWECVDFDFASGDIDCTDNCVLDFSGCTSAACGNGIIESGETCDPGGIGGAQPDLDGETCQSQGLLPGTLGLACETDCSGYDITGCADPSAWTCDTDWYDDGYFCDCGCGLVDLDCANANVESCDFCDMTGSCDDTSTCDNIDPTNNAVCSTAVWTCDPDYYDTDDGCDCGCGIIDPDCEDATLASCDFCAGDGSCSDEYCYENTQIDPSDNAVCL